MVDRAKLVEAFPQEAIKIREGKFRYVEGHSVIHRLIDATDNIYDAEIKDFQMRPWGTSPKGKEQFLVTCHVSLTIPELGTRDAVGVQVVFVGTGEDLLKGAETDGLKKAATKFGVALELYGPDYAHEADRMTTKQWKEIEALGRKAFSKREHMTAFVLEHTGTTTFSQMTWEQGEDMIEALKEDAARDAAQRGPVSADEWQTRMAEVKAVPKGAIA